MPIILEKKGLVYWLSEKRMYQLKKFLQGLGTVGLLCCIFWLPLRIPHDGTVPSPKLELGPTKKTSLKTVNLLKREVMKNPFITSTELRKIHSEALKNVIDHVAATLTERTWTTMLVCYC